jgi:hypothetical protein
LSILFNGIPGGIRTPDRRLRRNIVLLSNGIGELKCTVKNPLGYEYQLVIRTINSTITIREKHTYAAMEAFLV